MLVYGLIFRVGGKNRITSTLEKEKKIVKKGKTLYNAVTICCKDRKGLAGGGLYLKCQCNYISQHGKFKGSLAWLPLVGHSRVQ